MYCLLRSLLGLQPKPNITRTYLWKGWKHFETNTSTCEDKKGCRRKCSYRSFPCKVPLCTFAGRIPSVPDPDILRTYLANKDKDIIPRIPVKGRAVRLRTKMGMHVISPIDHALFSLSLNQNHSTYAFMNFCVDLSQMFHSQVRV